MSSTDIDMPPRPNITSYVSALKAFTSSQSTFKVLHTIPSSRPTPPPKELYILDSSFNPPTLAHFRIARNAILSSTSSTKKLILLLATKNADKASVPAAMEHRLCMMELLACDLLATFTSFKSQEKGINISRAAEDEGHISIDIALTKEPYFIQKSAAISSSNLYPSNTPQTHLIGFDTLTRILDIKYYEGSTLASLDSFFKNNKLEVTYRTDDKWGSKEDQDNSLIGIKEGELEREGARKEWVGEGRIRMVEGRKEGEEVVSSTKVREAVKSGDKDALEKLLSTGVTEWVLGEKLYLED